MTYTFTVVENRLPLKKWTATSVINRLLDITEPIRYGEKPRFRLKGMNEDGTMQAGSQAERFDGILSPEFSFTKQTLRECLQDVGQVTHGEPRLTPVKDSSGKWVYEVSYDLYGQAERWKHANKACVKNSSAQNIASYASATDSNVENLVNKVGDEYGVITEPYAGGAKTLRAEQMYVQITEGNIIFPTQFPIYTVDKLEWVRVADSAITSVDITPYLFESSVYTSQLSSYESTFPYSKAYGLMYTQGEKNITMLNFKPEHPISAAFENYAILNVLRRASGDEGLTIAEATEGSDLSYSEGQYPQLAFRITYTPLYQSRVGQSKVNYQEHRRPAAMIYNQQANIVESRAFGENLKGVIARLGNAEQSRTYRLSRLSQIPKAGMRFDDDYVISGVYVEILSTVINCTISLTKDFNRISRYVGISSVKRFSQVSQSMALERNTLWKEYIVVGDKPTDASGFLTDATGAPYMTLSFMYAVKATFLQDDADIKPITHVDAFGTTGENGQLSWVSLPVVASAFGNSIAFSWEYADNYSAGAVSTYRTGGTGGATVSGYYQNDYQYTDYYGKVYYYDFALSPAGEELTPDTYLDVANALPGFRAGSEWSPLGNAYITTFKNITTESREAIILRKDSREKLQCNYQIDFVSNRKGLIIGSALASNCPAVRGLDASRRARMYLLQEEVPKFTASLRELGIRTDNLPSADVEITDVDFDGSFTVSSVWDTFPTSAKAWVICSPTTVETEEVETETGATEAQTTVRGGDILLAQNMPIAAGAAFTPITFTPVREVFDKPVWKDIR